MAQYRPFPGRAFRGRKRGDQPAGHLLYGKHRRRGPNILHLIHKKDPVLANNARLWDSLGFENVGIELECDPYSPKVFSEGESSAEENSSLFGNINLAWNILDHCQYMGVFVGPRPIF